ncbi:C-type Lectin CRL-like [Polymixia lowei]
MKNNISGPLFVIFIIVTTANRNCTFIHREKWSSKWCSLTTDFLCNNGNTLQVVKESKTWEDAQLYCEENYQGLATITEENVGLIVDSNVWIGLFRDVDDVWKWAGETQSDFRNWGRGQPDNQDCGGVKFVTSSSPYKLRWFSKPCSAKKPFLCYNEKLILVKENKTWEEALEFCRSLTPV